MSQYFENDINIESDPKVVTCWCGDKNLSFITDHGIFSYGEIDDASLKLVRFCKNLNGEVLDLGCGYGFIGIYLKTKYPHITLYQSDINERALVLCKKNCDNNSVCSSIICSNSYDSLPFLFDDIVLNPPIHAGKDTCFKLITDSVDHLKKNGSMFIVIRKKHGADSYIRMFQNNRYNYSILDKKDNIYIIQITK